MHNPWFPQLADPGPARIDLVCFPHAGGGASLYYRWSGQIPEMIRLVPVRLPGREQRYREPAFRSIQPLAKAVGHALLTRPQRPFVLLGQSMGALVAFELARWLRRGGQRQPHGLVVASAAAPQIASFPEPIHGLPRQQFLDQLQRRYGGLPQAVAEHQELMDLLLPTLRADVQAVETYTYREEPPLDCPILAVVGTDDRRVSPSELAAWGEQTTAAFANYTIPGDHFVLDTRRHIVLPLLVDWIEQLVS